MTSARALYVGILTPGSTSRMRAEWLRRLTPNWSWRWIDTDQPFSSSSRVWRSLAFRHKTGKAIQRINAHVRSALGAEYFDLAWVDKGVFLERETSLRIRHAVTHMVHFTPDTSFGKNRSRHFDASLELFDLVVTTKSFEVPEYLRRVDRQRVFLTTQGFDPAVHFPRLGDIERRREVVFVGLAEPHREKCIACLLEHDVRVRLSGRGWTPFLRKWGKHRRLVFEAEDMFGEDYASMFSRSWIGLGLISKRFPELHTTRTFEIPACGAILATEQTPETNQFFTEDEALFFSDEAQLASRVKSLLSRRDDELNRIAAAGRDRVARDRRDYPHILSEVLMSPVLVDLPGRPVMR